MSESSDNKYNVEYKNDAMKNNNENSRKEKNKKVFEDDEPELDLDHSRQDFDEDLESGIDREEGNNDSEAEDVPEEEIRNVNAEEDGEGDSEEEAVSINHEDISQFDDDGDINRDENNSHSGMNEGDIPDGEVEEKREKVGEGSNESEDNSGWYSSEEDIIY